MHHSTRYTVMSCSHSCEVQLAWQKGKVRYVWMSSRLPFHAPPPSPSIHYVRPSLIPSLLPLYTHYSPLFPFPYLHSNSSLHHFPFSPARLPPPLTEHVYKLYPPLLHTAIPFHTHYCAQIFASLLNPLAAALPTLIKCRNTNIGYNFETTEQRWIHFQQAFWWTYVLTFLLGIIQSYSHIT